MRRRLPQGVRMYTGDDFNYAELIAGDAHGHSDALLGIFDAIAPAAAAALGALHARRPRHASTTSWRRPCRCRATSSRRRPGSTRPAWCSWPTSTACRTISPWSAGRRARARRCISRELFRLADAAGLLPTPSGRRRACASCWRRGAWPRDARPVARSRAALDQLDDGEGLVARRSWPRAARAPASARSRRGATSCRPAASERGEGVIRTHGLTVYRALPRRHVPGRRRGRAARRARRQPPRGRRGGRDRRAMPGAGGRRPAEGLARHRRRARAGARRHRRRCCPTRGRPVCRSRSSRCIRCMPPTAPA